MVEKVRSSELEDGWVFEELRSQRLEDGHVFENVRVGNIEDLQEREPVRRSKSTALRIFPDNFFLDECHSPL